MILFLRSIAHLILFFRVCYFFKINCTIDPTKKRESNMVNLAGYFQKIGSNMHTIGRSAKRAIEHENRIGGANTLGKR